MGIRDVNCDVIISSAFNGEIIDTIPLSVYDKETIALMVANIFINDFDNKQGLLIKYGYRN